MEFDIRRSSAYIKRLWILLQCFTIYVSHSTLVMPTNEKITVTLKGGRSAEPPFHIVMDDQMKIDNPEYPTHSGQIEERGQTSMRDVIDITHGAKVSLRVTKYRVVVYQQKGKPSNHFIPGASIHMVCGGPRQPEHCIAAPALAQVTWRLVSGDKPIHIISNSEISEHNPDQRNGRPDIEVTREKDVSLKLSHFTKLSFRVGSSDNVSGSVLITRSGVIGCHTNEEPPRCSYKHNPAKNYLGQPTLLI